MMNKNANNEDLGGRSAYLRDIHSVSMIVFMVSLMTAQLINTQVGMKQIAAQLIRMRK
jgi:hypothetical protein